MPILHIQYIYVCVCVPIHNHTKYRVSSECSTTLSLCIWFIHRDNSEHSMQRGKDIYSIPHNLCTRIVQLPAKHRGQTKGRVYFLRPTKSGTNYYDYHAHQFCTVTWLLDRQCHQTACTEPSQWPGRSPCWSPSRQQPWSSSQLSAYDVHVICA